MPQPVEMGESHKSAPPPDRNQLIETANEDTRGILRPIGGLSTAGSSPVVPNEVLPQVDRTHCDVDLDEELHVSNYVDETDDGDIPFGSYDDIGFGLDAAQDEPLEVDVTVPKPLPKIDVEAIARRLRGRISIRAMAARVSVPTLIPDGTQLRTAASIAAIFALVLSLAVAYHLPTSAYGLKALGVIAAASMGFSALAWPLKLRILARWVLAACAVLAVYYCKPVDALAEMGAEVRIHEPDPIVRGTAARTLAILGRKDFTGLDLHGANLGSVDLSFALLYGVDLRGADLSYANLGHAKLTLTKMASVDLGNANLVGANLERAVGYAKAHCNRRTKLPVDFTCQNGKPIFRSQAP